MKNNKILKYLFLLFISTSFFYCSKSESIPEDIQVHDFVWKGLNAYYLWQKDIPDLQDNRFNNQTELNSYLQSFSSPEILFESLLNRPADRFSVIVDDYVALENSLQGLSLSNGMEFGLVRYSNNATNLFGYVRYVVPGSDAETQGVQRGMLFNTIDGQQLTDTNFGGLLFGSSTTYTVGFANYNNGDPTSNGNSVTLVKLQLQENPIGLSKVIDYNGKKIGYLFYNQFIAGYEPQLNAVFQDFKLQNIEELIIDLRYNPGGRVSTASNLGSMITGQFSGQLFSQEVWNDKVMNSFDPATFQNNFNTTIDNAGTSEAINSLNLSRVYCITSGATASASELLINSLRSYIDVRLVGTQTIGKQQGSITLYDSDNLLKGGPNFNRNHTYALQPLVLEITNKDNANEPNGFIPGSSLPGILLAEDYGDLGQIGETTDPLLLRTLVYIDTGARFGGPVKQFVEHKEVFDSNLATPTSNNMYTEIKK
ncbi:MAG: peptidase S41 [Flavobacteriaceae bacterium]|nr:peptidase S41 [Flavobacteriaceae bacterium]|tara:strand:- start:259334 stop:260779 length:1446 start_codon:yes stop_codon:yes gene_type:complete